MKFLQNVLASLVALFIFSGLGFLFMIALAGIMTADKKTSISENSILHLRLKKPIAERSMEDPFAGFSIHSSGATGILDLKEAIQHAKDNENITGIYLDPKFIMAGFGHAEELRNALEDFRSSGKFIIAWSDLMSEGSYYICSVADSIFLHPEGDLEFNGLAYTLSFFKGTFEKLDIEPQIFRVGDYKSAVEPFIRKDMSDENRMQVASFIDDIYDHITKDIASSRGLDNKTVNDISSGLLVRKVEDAVDLGLIDGLRYYDEIEDILREISGLEEDEKIKLVTLNKYLKSFEQKSSSKNRIAVIMASGEIVFGEGEQDNIGSEKFTKEIRKARKSSRIKAIVLRINSPGGNFIASDELWREVYLASQEKPVIASMSNYAASGGYYMAMAADTIIAYPNTITGSIGIYSILFNISGFLENKLGITSDVVKTGEYSDIFTVSRPLTEYEKSIFQKQAENGYETFITKAAEGRGMSVEEISKIASGRVWTGSQALENGLVDMLGTFDDAVRIAAEKAGIEDDYKLRYYPVQKSFWEQLLADLGQDVQAKLIRAKAGELYPYIDMLKKIKNYQGVQARMPYELHTGF